MNRQLIICVMLALCPAAVWAGPTWFFYELYGTNDPGLTSIVGAPSLNNTGQVAFLGGREGTWQCFRGSGEVLTRMDDPDHPASLVYETPMLPTINDAGVVGYARVVGETSWAYRSDGTTITHLFPSLSSPMGTAISNSGAVATLGWDTADGKCGIFVTDGTTVTTVAKTGMTAPGSGGTFTGFMILPHINNSGTVVFFGDLGTVQGIYSWSGGVLSRVMDESCGVAPDDGPAHVNDSGVVAFAGANVGDFHKGVYTSTGGNTCQRIVDTTGIGLAGGADSASVVMNNNGLVAFAAASAPSGGYTGIYTRGAITSTVAVEGGMVNGRSVSDLTFRAEGLNDFGQIAFRVQFAGDANAYIYLASPFPCAAPMGLARGTGTVTYAPDGFAAGGFTTAGLGGATPLPGTVDIDGLTLDGGMATVISAYNPSDLAALSLDEASLRLYWDNAGVWVLAGRQSNLDQTTGAFVAGAPTAVLGDWGIDLGANYVWANVDHASTFAVAGVPEPATLALAAMGV
ncbi:MAG: choice-of-anchor tandem repeat NxxGxxAF-containing protein [Phycisphaerae bacterium]